MLDDSIKTRSLDEREEMQREYGTNKLPYQDLCYATYTTEDGEKCIVDVIGTNEEETQAILSLEENGKRAIWHAYRDQSGKPDTWCWTTEQLAAAKKNQVRISEKENDFRGEKASAQRRQVAPIHKDRRIELLMLGLQLNKSDNEVQEQLRKEGLDHNLPENYRTEEGELDLLKNWLPSSQKKQQ